MQIFWWQHGLHIQPENSEEAAMMIKLVDSVKFGPRPGSPSEQIAKGLIGDHETVPDRMASVDLDD